MDNNEVLKVIEEINHVMISNNVSLKDGNTIFASILLTTFAKLNYTTEDVNKCLQRINNSYRAYLNEHE